MADGPIVGFSPFSLPSAGVLVVFCDETLRLGPATRRLLGAAAALVARAAAADRFKEGQKPSSFIEDAAES